MYLPTEELIFHKSSHSTTAQECVEVAGFTAGAAVRDTQNRNLGHLAFPSKEWSALLGTVRR